MYVSPSPSFHVEDLAIERLEDGGERTRELVLLCRHVIKLIQRSSHPDTQWPSPAAPQAGSESALLRQMTIVFDNDKPLMLLH